jgi:hypothetical protein
MLVKTQEKVSEYIILSLASAASLAIAGVIPKNLNPEGSGVLNSIAQALAAVIILGIITFVPKILSRRNKDSTASRPEGIVHPDEYMLSPLRVAVYGTLLFIAGSYLLSFISGILLSLFLNGSAIDISSDQFMLVAATPLLFGQSITAYLIGRWIGSRSSRGGFLAAMVVVVIGRVLLIAGDAMLGFGVPLDTTSIGFFLLLTIGIGVFAGFGFWRGTKVSEAGYIWYMLSKLPSDSRKAIEELLYEEVLARVKEIDPHPVETG